MDKMLIWFGIFLLLGGLFGYGINEIMDAKNQDKLFDGLRFQLKGNWSEAINHAYQQESNANWVCVNVKGMTYERATQVCNHEVGHEIFATHCQDNINECINITK